MAITPRIGASAGYAGANGRSRTHCPTRWPGWCRTSVATADSAGDAPVARTATRHCWRASLAVVDPMPSYPHTANSLDVICPQRHPTNRGHILIAPLPKVVLNNRAGVDEVDDPLSGDAGGRCQVTNWDRLPTRSRLIDWPRRGDILDAGRRGAAPGRMPCPGQCT